MRPPKVLLAIRRSQSRSDYVVDLRRSGFQVTTADDGIECLDVLSRFIPDAVVVEPELLWGGGDGVVALLRDKSETRSVPVLVLTTDASRSAVYRISQFPIGDFLTQPVSPQRLTGSVTRLAKHDQFLSDPESRSQTASATLARSPTTSSYARNHLTPAGVG